MVFASPPVLSTATYIRLVLVVRVQVVVPAARFAVVTEFEPSDGEDCEGGGGETDGGGGGGGGGRLSGEGGGGEGEGGGGEGEGGGGEGGGTAKGTSGGRGGAGGLWQSLLVMNVKPGPVGAAMQGTV